MPSEPLPVSDVLDTLDATWNYTKVSGSTSKPGFVEVTGAGDPLRIDLNVNDQIVGQAGNPAMSEQPIGNYKYGNRDYTVELQVYTLESRLRLYDVMREIRRIMHIRVHDLTNFQRVRFVNFTELTQEQVNLWTGTITIQLENRAILLELT